MAAGDLTTVANAITWLGLPDSSDAATVQRLISAVSTQIQRCLNYQVVSQAYSRVFNGRGTSVLRLPDVPVTAVASVSIDGVTVPAGSGTQPGYYFDDRSVGLVGGGVFTRGYQNVAVAYTAGYAAVPPDIEQACLELVRVNYAQRRDPARDPAAALLRAGDTEMRFAVDAALTPAGVIPMPPRLFAMLAPYRRVSPA